MSKHQQPLGTWEAETKIPSKPAGMETAQQVAGTASTSHEELRAGIATTSHEAPLSSTTRCKTLYFKHRPEGKPSDELGKDFEIKECDAPRDCPNNGVLTEIKYFSVDPYLRYKMMHSFEEGKPLEGFVAGVIRQSKHADWKSGDRFGAVLPLSSMQQVTDFTTFRKLTDYLEESELDLALGLFGMPGSLAYAAFDLMQVQASDAVWINSCCGAVGSLAGQLAKNVKKCKLVIGSCGCEEKCDVAKEKFGYDVAFDHCQTREGELEDKIRKLAPDGLDFFLETVGGSSMLNAAVENMNPKGRIAIAGAISGYDLEHEITKKAQEEETLLGMSQQQRRSKQRELEEQARAQEQVHKRGIEQYQRRELGHEQEQQERGQQQFYEPEEQQGGTLPAEEQQRYQRVREQGPRHEHFVHGFQKERDWKEAQQHGFEKPGFNAGQSDLDEERGLERPPLEQQTESEREQRQQKQRQYEQQHRQHEEHLHEREQHEHEKREHEYETTKHWQRGRRVGQHYHATRHHEPELHQLKLDVTINEMSILFHQLRIEGLSCFDWLEGKRGNFLQDMHKWHKEGLICQEDTVFQGMEKWPDAFAMLFETGNKYHVGKMIVKL